MLLNKDHFLFKNLFKFARQDSNLIIDAFLFSIFNSKQFIITHVDIIGTILYIFFYINQMLYDIDPNKFCVWS